MIELEYDIVVIGSGAGGGTVAHALGGLAADGRRVLVLEQGGRLADSEFTGNELDMSDALYEDGGGFLTADGTMTLAFGRIYGGSTVVYTGTSLVAPRRVIERWGVPGLTHADVEERSRRYMRDNNVHLLPDEELNENNRLFVAGCERAGYHAEQFPLNVRGCRGSSLCNLGCPNGAKMGTNRVQLPAAERMGVEVVTRAEALRVEDRAVVARVRERREGEKGAPSEWAPGSYRIRAGIVVCAGGSVGTSALLLRSGLARAVPRLGEGFTCHPAHILVAEHSRAITNDLETSTGVCARRRRPRCSRQAPASAAPCSLAGSLLFGATGRCLCLRRTSPSAWDYRPRRSTRSSAWRRSHVLRSRSAWCVSRSSRVFAGRRTTCPRTAAATCRRRPRRFTPRSRPSTEPCPTTSSPTPIGRSIGRCRSEATHRTT